MRPERQLKERERDQCNDEITRLKGKVCEMTLDTALWRANIARLEAGAPFGRGDEPSGLDIRVSFAPLPRPTDQKTQL